MKMNTPFFKGIPVLLLVSLWLAACPMAPAPDTPTGVNAAPESSATIRISWSAVSGATTYKVYRSDKEAGTYTSIASTNDATYLDEKLTANTTVGTVKTETASTDTVNYTDTGLTANTTYYYKVAAINTAGESAKSAAVSAKTKDAASISYKVSDDAANFVTGGSLVLLGMTEDEYNANKGNLAAAKSG